MADIEDELRVLLRERATDPSPEFRGHVDRRATQALRRRRITIAAAVVGALAVIAVVGAALAAPDHEKVRTVDSTTASTAPQPVGRWNPISKSPLSPRGRHVMVWTGEEVLVVGGSSDPECLNAGGNGCWDADSDAPGVREGAAYDPASDSWRRIADAPVPIGVYDAAQWVGDVALFATQFTHRLVAYDPVRDRWTERSTQVLPTGFGQNVSVGDRWVAMQSDDLSGQPDMAYDPATDRWNELPEDPLGPSTNRFVVWSGSKLVLLAKPPGASVQNPQPTRVATFDPATSTWTRLPDSPITTIGQLWYQAGPDAVATWSPDENGSVAAFPGSGIVDLSSGETHELPSADTDDGQLPILALLPSASGGASWSFAGVSGRREGDPAWLASPETGAVHRLPPPPGRPEIASVDVEIWTGTELIRWGGTSSGARRITASAAVAYKPPPP